MDSRPAGGPGDTPGCLVGCPGLCPGPRPTRQSWLQAMFLWRGREGSLGAGCSRIARGRRGGCLLVTSTPCPAGHGCITSTRPSCSRQRPGECAAAGGLCAAEAQLRDLCSCRPTSRACSPPQASSWERCVTSRRRRCRPWQHVQAVYRQHAAQIRVRYGRRLGPGIARRIDRQVAQVAAAIRRCGSYPALSATTPRTPPASLPAVHPRTPAGSVALLRLPARAGAPPMA